MGGSKRKKLRQNCQICIAHQGRQDVYITPVSSDVLRKRPVKVPVPLPAHDCKEHQMNRPLAF